MASPTNPNTPQSYAPLTEYLGRWLAAAPAAGLSISVTDRRETRFTAGVGYADLAARSPVLAGTTFQIGSIGKSFTALALLQLVQAGRLDLNAPISTHLPWLAMPSRYGPITLRHLLSHTAGLPAGTDFAPAARYEGYALRDTEAAWEPGSRFHYSNTGYKLLGWLLEDVTGLDYGSIIRQRVLEPLGMHASHPVISHRTWHDMATGYVDLHDDRPRRLDDTLIPAHWSEYAVGDGSQVSTVGDMARYARLWLNDGRGELGPVVSPALYRQMTTPTIAMPRGEAEEDYRYGFGIISHRGCGHHFIGHGGGTVGFRSIMITDQTDGLGVVILCNGSSVDLYPAARFALQVASAVRDGDSIPEAPALSDPTRVESADRYAGHFIDEASGAALTVTARDGRLLLHRQDRPDITLEHIGGNTFCVPDDDFDPFPLRFRAPEDAGHDVPMVEMHHGPTVYVRDGATPLAVAAPYPPEWNTFPGHYRSHAPYLTSFRVILRRGRLYLAWPNGGEEPLTPRAGEPAASPRFDIGPVGEPTAEWIRFDTVVGSRALRARWAGGGSFYRV
ncbi:MAG: serine hydrolase [Chloroflexi bacterium]|nr:serine hydrolase [Chloroflexota bacterium]